MSNIFQDLDAGVSEFLQWRFRAAQMMFHKCIQKDDRFDPGVFMLGLAQLMNGSFREATESFKSFLSLAETRGSSICKSLGLYKLGLSQKCDGQLMDALKTLRAAYSDRFTNSNWFLLLVGARPFIFETGIIHLELGNHDIALSEFELAHKVDILSPAAHLELAQYLIHKKNNEDYRFSDSGMEFATSIGEIGNLLKFYTDAAVVYHQALCLELLGRSDKAKEAYAEVKRLDPNYSLSRFDRSLIEGINRIDRCQTYEILYNMPINTSKTTRDGD